jgi:ABC-type branched-subunit amino acid transport system substrate-binding protein
VILTGRAALATLLAATACSPNFHPRGCSGDADCGDGLVCVETQEAPVCESAGGVSLHIGMSAPISGTSQNLGIEMREGVTLAFDEQNATGGVRGRKLALEFRDDGYNPADAESAVRDLLDLKTDSGTSPRCPTTSHPLVAGQMPAGTTAMERGPNAVLALLGNVGTPTMVRTAPLAVESSTLFFGAFTGATLMLRDMSAGPCAKYIFNVRASYAEEARATTEFFLKLGVPDDRHILSFDQSDSFGQAGYDGLVAAYTALRGAPSGEGDANTPIARFRYARDDETSVPAQVDLVTQYLTKLLSDGQSHTVGVFMTDTYGPASAFITGLRDWQYQGDDVAASRLKLILSNVSFVGPDSLARRLKEAGTVQTANGDKPYSDAVFVSQVVPNYQTNPGDLVRDYQKALATDGAGVEQSFTSLEGYLAARVFIAGLLEHQGRFTPEALVPTFERLPDLAFGIGASAKFSSSNHQYSKSVWGTAIEADGTFSDRYFWTEGSALQLAE